jgi:aspartyl-tRNA(Asn)/glutamyl-tRNA(Gln) amidotransferase subunit B
LERQYALPKQDAQLLTASRSMADYFEDVARHAVEPKLAANWILNDLIFLLQENKKEFTEYPVSAENLAELIALVAKGDISGKMGKDILAEMVRTRKRATAVIAEKGLAQIADPEAIAKVVREIMSANPKQVEQYRSGKTATLGWFVGQVMKATRGQANPQLVQEVLKRELSGDV